MTTSVQPEVQLHLLEELISLYTRQEVIRLSPSGPDNLDKIEQINQNWKKTHAKAEELIKADPAFEVKRPEDRCINDIRTKIIQITDANKIPGEAYREAFRQWGELHERFALMESCREYQAMQSYLRSLATHSTPRVTIFDEIDRAIEDLKQIEQLAVDLGSEKSDSENSGKEQLRLRIEQFVKDIKAILNNGKGSLALETVG